MPVILERLRQLRDLGILNLHLVVVGPRDTPYTRIQHEKRSLVSQLRESKRREKRFCGIIEYQREQSKRRAEEYQQESIAEQRKGEKREAEIRKALHGELAASAKREVSLRKELTKTQKALAQAEKKVEAFIKENPDWKEPEHQTLNRQDSRDFYHAFQDVDRNLDIQRQMKHDPSGLLTTWWAEQRRRLKVNKRAKWHPEVLRYCFFLWNKVGNKTFNRLRNVMVLPAIRTMQRMQTKYAGSGSGYQKDMFVKVAKIFASQAESVEDRDWTANLSWDATGYAKRIVFNKHTGALVGLDIDTESFNMQLETTNKVSPM